MPNFIKDIVLLRRYSKGSKDKAAQKGFTLIEMIMVLTIIFVLIGAAITGTSLINESRLQSVIDDITRFRTAVAAFKLQYGQFPGDFANAYAYFGNTCDPVSSNCNGNGDGRVDENLTDLNQNESFRVWQHLNLSEILLGDFSGKGLRSLTPYTSQLPFSKYPNSVYGFMYHTSVFSKSGNAIFVGSSASADYTYASLTVPDAIAIDKKMDDGLANQGFVFGVNGTTLNANECSAPATNTTGDNYNFAADGKSCRLIFWYDKMNG